MREDVNSFIFAPYEIIKKIILEKRDNLQIHFIEYRRVTKLRGVEKYKIGWMKWINALNDLYLEVRAKIKKKEYREKYNKTIELLESSLKDGEELTEEQAVKCTLRLVDFCEEMGITDIMIEKHDPGKAVTY